MARLKAKSRSETGTRRARVLRSGGKIPAVIYGHGIEAQPITLDAHEVELAVMHGERFLEVVLDGKKQNALIKEVQYDTFGQDILHVDLARVSLHERVEVTVPIVLRGTPAGVNEGGVLQQIAAEVGVECEVSAIPEEITVPVTELNIGDSLSMGDLPLPENTKLTKDPEGVVCTVSVVAEKEEAPEEEAAEEAAEPEVIGAKPEEEKPEGEQTEPSAEKR